MDFWKSLGGLVEAELTSADIAAALAAVNGRNITLYRVRQVDDLTAQLCLKRKDYHKLAKLAEERGERLRIVRRRGLYWPLAGLKGRPVLLCSFIFLLILVLYLPSRVFFVRVEGNVNVPTRLILEAAGESGICFGASRREVRSEKMKNALLSAVPQLQWAGVNTAGCVATISVRERSLEDTADPEDQVSSIVATRDGYIVSATATNGNLLCQPGQTVKEGQVLISGYTDCGICIQATRAEGEVFAQTTRVFSAVKPLGSQKKVGEERIERKISLLIGKKRINLWKDSGIWDATCGRIYEEYYITLPGGFRLPAAVCIETYTDHTLEAVEVTKQEAEAALSDYAAVYLQNQMIAGSILTGQHIVTLEDGFYQLQGSFVCVEMIGREQQEQIGDTNGKSD